MLLEVQTDGQSLRSDTTSGLVKPPPGVTLKLTETKEFRDGGATILVFTLLFARDVAIGIVAAWLYDLLKGRASNVRVGGKQVEIDKSKLASALEQASDA
jgi:hypothetical protein